MSYDAGVLSPPSCRCGCGLPCRYDRRISGFHSFLRGHASRKHTFDRSLFVTIQNELDAYWLGFFFADGFVKTKGTFGFCLSSRDRHHLERFREHAKTSQPIEVYGDDCRLEICAKLHLAVLEQYGLVQGKSYGIVVPVLPPELRAAFVRGVFDGDGWITVDKRSRSLQFGIVGSVTLLAGLQAMLVEECRLNWTKLRVDKRHSTGIVSIVYGGNRACSRIFDFLYRDASVYLERKYEVWANHLPV